MAIMWRQYTRETPAKPGWALIAMVVTFTATLAAAQWVVSYKTIRTRQALDQWPIAFTLPSSYRWSKAPSIPMIDQLVKSTGLYRAAFIGRNEASESCHLEIRCMQNAEIPDSSEKIGNGLRSIVGLQTAIHIGPLSGYYVVEKNEDLNGLQLQAQAVSEKGLRIEVFLYSDASIKHAEALLKEVCRDVELIEP